MAGHGIEMGHLGIDLDHPDINLAHQSLATSCHVSQPHAP